MPQRASAMACLTLLSVVASGCFSSALREAQERKKADFAAKDAALAQCAARYPEGTKEVVARMNCTLAAHRITRPYYTYPDLFDQEAAYSAMIAERVQSGKMTSTEGTAALMDNHAKQVAEEERRINASRSVRAQERAAVAQEDAADAASRANSPITCTRAGYSVTCF